jgi:hypothetical protein
MRLLLAITVLSLAAAVQPTTAALVVDSVSDSFSQDFNSLMSGADGANWQNDITLPGWSLFRLMSGGGSTPIVRYELSNGSHDEGRFYSYGTNITERALGSVGNGSFGDSEGGVTNGVGPNSPAGWIAVSFFNDTGIDLDEFTMHYDGEQWRDGGNDPPFSQTMEFEYGIGSTFGSVMSWHKPGASFNFVSPQNTIVAGALDGNRDDIVMVNRIAGIGGTVTGVGWDHGETLWLRWIELNNNASDHGLAIDNFSFSVTAVPEPGAVLYGVVVLALAFLAALINSSGFKFGFRSTR